MPVETTFMTLAGRPCVIPERPGMNLGYLCPLGPVSGYGACLMTWGELSAINVNAYVTLSMGAGGTVISLPGLIVAKAQKVSRSASGLTSGLYKVELADKRLILNKFTDTRRQFNVWNPRQRATSIDAPQNYYAETLDGSDLWTWSRVAQALWTDCGFLGSFAFPSVTLNDRPKNLHYWGVNAWRALHEVLAFVGMTTAYDPVAATFSIVSMGQVQPGLAAVVTAAGPRYFGSADPIESNLAKYPETIKVYFPRRDRHFGTERDSVSAGNWITEPARTSVKSTGAAGAQAGSVLQMWDTQPSIYGYTAIAENAVDTNAIAERRKNDWLNDQLYSESRARTVYSGILSGFRCGSQVKAVHWRYLGDGEQPGGFLTEVSRHPGLPASLHTGEEWGEEYESFRPEFSRHSTPHYPDSTQIVVLGVQQSNFATWSGTVGRLDPAITVGGGATFSNLETCFIQFINSDAARVVPTTVAETTKNHTLLYKPKAGDRYEARANGVTTSVGDVTLPLYTARLDNPQLIWWAELYEDVDAGTYSSPSGPFEAKLFTVSSGAAWTDTGLILNRIYNTGSALVSGTRVMLYFDQAANLFHVLGVASAGAMIRLVKLSESLYPCTSIGSVEGPVTAAVYDCEVLEGAPNFTPSGDTLEVWNATATYYEKDTFALVSEEAGCGVAMIIEGFHPGVHLATLGSPLASGGTSTATLQVGEDDVDIVDPFFHPIDPGSEIAIVHDGTGDWFPVQVEMSTDSMVCAVVCSPTLQVSYREVLFDYAIEVCPAPDAVSSSSEEAGGLSHDLLSVSFPPEILTEYVDVSVLAAINTNPAVPGFAGGGGYQFGTDGPVGP